MPRHPLSLRETATVLQVVRDPRSTKAVIANPAANAGFFSSSLDHPPGILPAHPFIGELAGTPARTKEKGVPLGTPSFLAQLEGELASLIVFGTIHCFLLARRPA